VAPVDDQVSVNWSPVLIELALDVRLAVKATMVRVA
jgi:hypothetical protein